MLELILNKSLLKKFELTIVLIIILVTQQIYD